MSGRILGKACSFFRQMNRGLLLSPLRVATACHCARRQLLRWPIHSIHACLVLFDFEVWYTVAKFSADPISTFVDARTWAAYCGVAWRRALARAHDWIVFVWVRGSGATLLTNQIIRYSLYMYIQVLFFFIFHDDATEDMISVYMCM